MRLDEMGSWILAIAVPLALIASAIPVITMLQAVAYPESVMEFQPMWTADLERADAALAGDDVGGALRAWRAAYTSALGSRRWDAMLDVGDAYLRIGGRAHMRNLYETKAREAYLIALFRARREGALDGVLRTGQAFAALGDRAVVGHCIRIAEGLAAQRGDTESRDRVRQWADRLSNSSIAATQQELP